MTLEHTLDQVFSLYIRLRDADEDGYIRCCTCGKKVYFKSAECGHFVKRRKMSTRYNEKNCSGQCFECNHGDDMDTVHALWLDNKYGEGTSDELRRLGRTHVKFTESELREKIAYYRAKVRELKKSVNCELLF